MLNFKMKSIILIFYAQIFALKGSSTESEAPTMVTYYTENGKIIEEHGFWDNNSYVNAFKEIQKSDETDNK